MKKAALTQADLDAVQGMSSREAAEKLGVGKSTVNDARERARQNGGRLPSQETTVEVTTSVPQTKEQIDAALAVRGISHETHKVSERFSTWQSGDQTRYSYSASATPKPVTEMQGDLTSEDLPTLYSNLWNVSERTRLNVSNPKKSLVVVWADVQTGKTGSRGGTPELIARVAEKRQALETLIDGSGASEAFFLSVGDEVESFENTPQQAFTNDLSFPQQLDLELTFEMEFVKLLAQTHDYVTVAGISSNHCRWRAGKNALGKPSDDYGLYLKKQLEKALRLSSAYDGVSFLYPEDWDETMVVPVQDIKIGLAHGHQVNNPNNIQKWWTEQAFGGQPLADADVLLTGHFHTFRAQPMGRSARTGKSRWWLQAPTLDNGSDWFRNLRGDDSDPGLLVFEVTDEGFDLGSLTIL